MKKVNYVFFTEVITILSEKGEEKLSKVNSNVEAKDENGFTLEWYKENNLRPPKDLENETESLVSEDGFMKLDEGEFTYDFQNRFIDMSDFFTAVEADEFGTIIEFNNGMTYWIEEDLFEVYARIYVSRMNWFERFKESFSHLFGAIKKKLTKENNNGKSE